MKLSFVLCDSSLLHLTVTSPSPPSFLSSLSVDMIERNILFMNREGEWDFYWCDVGWMREYFDHTYMDEHVKICHFRNHYEVNLVTIITTALLGITASRVI